MDNTKTDEQPTTSRKRSAVTNNSFEAFIPDCQQQPSSPASSSTSQTTGDTTFEPSIDMMVNDFDDEQTLTEEEALAKLEAQDPADEVATLQRESEIPLEDLLPNYREHMRELREKLKWSAENSSVNQLKKQSDNLTAMAAILPMSSIDEVIIIDESDDEVELLKIERMDAEMSQYDSILKDCAGNVQIANDENGDNEECEFGLDDLDELDTDGARAVDFNKRSHLLELYPEKFANIPQKLDDDLSEDDEDDLDYVKKTIMVGSAYQATIPTGLSKYGDVLPYENEDKLIWEPSQVSEKEVEEYLIRVREIRLLVQIEPDQGPHSSGVRDDEQALHLLVQCGYNFKEALRRHRLSAVPLTGTMSLWSEEECRNFEEGIQKFGKDFRKIRQTQVRTRTIRELIQFYYLWKKTERRDLELVDSDTIDHMDIYLDFDERDTASNGGGKNASSSLPSETFLTNQTITMKKQHHGNNASSSKSKNFSIMNETKRSAGSSKKSPGSKKSKALSKTYSPYRRRCSSLLAPKETEGKIIFSTKCNLASLALSRKCWRYNTSTSGDTASSSTISSTTGNSNSKK